MDVAEVRATIFETAIYVYTSKLYRLYQKLILACDYVERKSGQPEAVSKSQLVRVRAYNALVDRYASIDSSLFYCYLDCANVAKRGHGSLLKLTDSFLLTLRALVQAEGRRPGRYGGEIKRHCDEFCVSMSLIAGRYISTHDERKPQYMIFDDLGTRGGMEPLRPPELSPDTAMPQTAEVDEDTIGELKKLGMILWRASVPAGKENATGSRKSTIHDTKAATKPDETARHVDIVNGKKKATDDTMFTASSTKSTTDNTRATTKPDETGQRVDIVSDKKSAPNGEKAIVKADESGGRVDIVNDKKSATSGKKATAKADGTDRRNAVNSNNSATNGMKPIMNPHETNMARRKRCKSANDGIQGFMLTDDTVWNVTLVRNRRTRQRAACRS
jgi:hypothetical protein